MRPLALLLALLTAAQPAFAARGRNEVRTGDAHRTGAGRELSIEDLGLGETIETRAVEGEITVDRPIVLDAVPAETAPLDLAVKVEGRTAVAGARQGEAATTGEVLARSERAEHRVDYDGFGRQSQDGVLVQAVGGDAGIVTLTAGGPTPAPAAPSVERTWAGHVREGWKDLSPSFHSFVYGQGMLSVAGIGMAVVVTGYAMSQFGLEVAALGQLINIGMRVLGSRYGARLVKRSKRFNEKTIYQANTVLQVLNTGAFVGAFFLFGADGWIYPAVFLANQIVHGLGNGSTDGMASNSIKPRLLPDVDLKRLLAANFVSTGAATAASLAGGFLASQLLVFAPPVPLLMLFASLQLSSLLFFRRMKLGPASRPAEDARPAGLPIRQYLPFIAVQFAITSFWCLLSPGFGVFVFGVPAMNGWAITAHLAGAAVFTLAGAFSQLRASSTGKSTPLSALSPRAWLGLLVVAEAAFLASGLGGAKWLYLASAAALGALININQGRWMAYYQSVLPQQRIGSLSAALTGIGMLLAAVPLAVVIVARLGLFSVVPSLWLASGIVLAAMVGLGLFSSPPDRSVKP